MYSIAFRIFLALLPFLAMVAAMLEVATMFLGTSRMGVNLFVSAFLALLFHRANLLGELDVWRRPKTTDGAPVHLPVVRFFVRFLLFLLPMAVVFFAVAIVAWRTLDPQVATISALVPAVLLFPFWGGWAGTMLPASAVGGDPTLAAALKRGPIGYWRTVRRLFAGPILFPLGALALTMGLVTLIPSLFAEERVWLVLISNTILSTIGFGTPLLTATALSMAYEEAEAPT